MQEKKLKTPPKLTLGGAIRSKTFIKNIFAYRGNFFNPEANYILQPQSQNIKNQLNNSSHKIEFKETSFSKPDTLFYTPIIKKSTKHHFHFPTKKLNHSLKNLNLRLINNTYKINNISIENEFDNALQVQ